MRRRLPFWLTVTAIILGTAFLYLAAAEHPFFAKLEGQSLTLRFQLRGPIALGPETLLVTIDDESLAALGRWPLPRKTLAKAVQKLHDLGAEVIVLDLLLTGEATEGPAAATLQDTVAAIGRVVLPYAFDYSGTGSGAALPESIRRTAYPLVRAQADADVGDELQPSGVLRPATELLEVALPAQANVFLASDGQLRYAFPALRYHDAYYPSLAVEAVRRFLDLHPDALRLDFGHSLMIGSDLIPLDRRSRSVVDHYGPLDIFDRIPLLDILTGDIVATRVKDRLVLVGATAFGVGDRFATPYSLTLPGVAYFASVIDNLLHDRTIQKQDDGTSLLTILLGGLLMACLVFLRRPLTALVIGMGLLLLWGLVSYWAFAWAALWLNFTFPAIAMLMTLLLVIVTLTLGQQNRAARAQLREAALSRFVSPFVVQSLERSEARNTYERTQAAAVLFVDIRDFTARCEHLPPQEAMALLRGFHQRVEDIALATGGTIDKFLGDGALLIFGLSEARTSDAKAALACALDLLADLAAWNDQLSAEGKPLLELGIGLHHGLVSLGEIGGRKQSQVTVAGDIVNTASRLQALSREHQASILASADFIARVKVEGGERLLDGFRPLPPVDIRGRQGKLEIWAWPSKTEAHS